MPIVERFQDWDHKFYTVWKYLERTKRKRLPYRSTRLDTLLRFETVEEMRSWWLAIPKAKRETGWPVLMLAAMTYHPGRVAQMLEATLDPSVTPSWAVADVFCFITKWSSTLPHDRQREQQAALPGLLLHLLGNSPPRHFQLQQWVLGRILSVCEPGSAAEIWKALRQYEHSLHWNTKLKLASIIAKDGKGRLAALQLFEEVLKGGGVDINDHRCAALASTLFTPPPRTRGGGRGSPVEAQLVAEAFERIVGIGVSLNVVTYTAMIRTLCLTDQLNTAWKVYDIMRDQGTEMDPHVFSILLNGAKRAGCLDSTIRVIEDASADALRTPHVWTDLIDTILKTATEETRSRSPEGPVAIPAFYSMLLVYAKFFKLEPLQRLIPLDLGNYLAEGDRDSRSDDWQWKAKLGLLIDELPAFPPNELAEPDVQALGLMLIGYVRSFAAASPVMSFYSHFRNLLRNRDPVAIALVGHSTLPYDTIIEALTYHVGMLRVVIDITNDMLQNATDSAAALKGLAAGADQENNADATPTATVHTHNPETSTNAPFYHPPPSVYTWSILVNAFIQQRRPYRAARLLDIMRTHGVEPNLVTYNMLISGFARVQDAGAVLRALQRVDEKGHHPDSFTFRGLAKLADPEPALAHLEQRSEESEAEYWRTMKAVAGQDSSGEAELAGLGPSHEMEVDRQLKADAERARRKDAKNRLFDSMGTTQEDYHRAVTQKFKRNLRLADQEEKSGIGRATGKEAPADARHTGRKAAGEQPTLHRQPTAKEVPNPRGDVGWNVRRAAVDISKYASEQPTAKEVPNPRGDVGWEVRRVAAPDISPTAKEAPNRREDARWRVRRVAYRPAADESTETADNNSAEHLRFMNILFGKDNKSTNDNSYTDTIPEDELDAYMQNYANAALTQARTNATPSATEEEPWLTPSERRSRSDGHYDYD
jgi:pentatricopeptide repeat protein